MYLTSQLLLFRIQSRRFSHTALKFVQYKYYLKLVFAVVPSTLIIILLYRLFTLYKLLMTSFEFEACIDAEVGKSVGRRSTKR